MTWTYTGTDPAASALNAVRVRVGDTDTNNQLLQNEEIGAFLAKQGLTNTTVPTTLNDEGIDLAAADACDAISARFAAKVASKSAIGMSRALFGNVQHYADLAARYRSGKHAYRANIKVGGIDEADMDDLDQDTDLIQPEFKIGQDDYKNAAVSIPDDGWEGKLR